MFNYSYVDYKPFTWEPPLDPPVEKVYCQECGYELEYDRVGQLKSCMHGEVDYDY